MSAKPAAPTISHTGLGKLLARCRELCDGAAASLVDLPRSKEFLTTSLQDALQHVELILRVLGKETGREEEPQGFLSRLERSHSRRKEGQAAGDEPPELNVSQQGLQGNSWTIPLAELIGFLAYGRKTGVLWVDTVDENFLLGMKNGQLLHATSDRTPEGLRLGEVLVGLGYLTRRQLERFLVAIGSEEKQLTGEALLEAGMITADELQAALTHQVQRLFQRLIETRNAIFKFREGMQVALAYQVDLDVPKLLLEAARVRDERSSGKSLEAIVSQIAASSHDDGEWDSWNREMLTELERIVQTDGPGGNGTTGGNGGNGAGKKA